MMNLLKNAYFKYNFKLRTLLLVFVIFSFILTPFKFSYDNFSFSRVAGINFLYADEIKIKASTDKSSASLGEEMVLTISVSSNGQASLEPKMPPLDGFKIQNASTSSRISIINGVRSIQMDYLYSIYPIKKGKITIGEFVVDYTDDSGKPAQAKTLPITIDVTEEKPGTPDKGNDSASDKSAEAKTSAAADDDNRSSDSGGLSWYLFLITIIIVMIFISVWFIAWQSKRKAYIMEKLRNQSNINSGKLQINNGAGAMPDISMKKTDVQEELKANNVKTDLNIKKYADVIQPESDFNLKLPANADDTFNLSITSFKKGDYRVGCSECSKFLKIVFEKNAGERLTELTTAEFITKLESKSVHPATISGVQSILELCDMVNYARYNPTENEVSYLKQELEKTYNNFRRGV